MARLFDGGADTDKLAVSSVNFPLTGNFSFGAWFKLAGTPTTNNRVFEFQSGDTGYANILVQTDLKVQGQVGSNPTLLTTSAEALTDGTWQFVVFTGDGSGTAANHHLWMGKISVAVSEPSVTRTDGVGNSSAPDVCIGNRNNNNRCFNGTIFCAFAVPWILSESDINTIRTGNLTPLSTGGTPTFVFGLEGSDLNSYATLGPSLTLTATGTTSVADPISLTLGGGNPSPSVIAVSVTVPSPTDLVVGFPSVIAVSSSVPSPTLTVSGSNVYEPVPGGSPRVNLYHVARGRRWDGR